MASGPVAGTLQARLARLRDAWRRKERQIDNLGEKIANGEDPDSASSAPLTASGISSSAPAAPPSRIAALLQQIAGCRAQEREIIGEINEMEQKHKFLRKQNKLKRAAPKPANWDDDDNNDREGKNEDTGLWWALLWLLALTRPKNINHKKRAPDIS